MALRLTIIVGALLVLASAGFAFIGSTAHPAQSGGPCISVSVASSMGGGIERACGTSARNVCQAAYQKQDVHSNAVREACHDAQIRP